MLFHSFIAVRELNSVCVSVTILPWCYGFLSVLQNVLLGRLVLLSVLLVEETEAGVKISALKCFPVSTLSPLSKQ